MSLANLRFINLKKALLVSIALVLLIEIPVGAVVVPEDFYSDSNIQFYDPNACSPGGESTNSTPAASGGVDYDNSQSADTNYEVSVETDGADGPAGGDGNHLSETSYGHNLGWKTHFVALNPEWDKIDQHKLKLGDVVKISWKGKTVFAIWGDNHSGGGVHTEVSLSVKKSLGAGSSAATGFGTKSNPVKFTIYPNTHQKINGNPPSKALIDQVGSSASGVSASESSSSGSSESAASCCPTATDSSSITSGDVGGDTDIEKVYNKLISLGLSAKAAAGIAGNTVYESGGASPTSEDLNPKSTNGTHWGIVQWDSGRWGGLVDFAGKKKFDLLKQAEYIMKELNGDYKSVKTEMEAAPTAAAAARIANAKYEITGMQEGRAQAAEHIYDKYGEGNTAQAATVSSQACACQDPDAATSGGPIANPQNLEDFVKSYADSALAAAKAEGIPYDAMLAQIALESGLPLSELASKYNNFGGIKFNGQGKATPPMRTYEEGQGYIMARFRAFDSPQEGLVQQAKFFTENSRYSKALKYPRNARQFIREVAKAGYATDSQYASKVIAMLGQVEKILTSNGKPLSKDVQPDASHGPDQSDDATTTVDCASAVNGAVVDGFAFPVGGLKKSEVGTNSAMPCGNLTGGCHHDGSSAFDIGKGNNGILVAGSKGLPVYAIEDGTITMYNPAYNFGGKSFSGCPTYQLKGKSGWVYWYGHTANTSIRAGSKVKAGEKIAEIGASRCTGTAGTEEHLHIDRGKPKGHPGGSVSARDPSINKLMNKLWEALPQ